MCYRILTKAEMPAFEVVPWALGRGTWLVRSSVSNSLSILLKFSCVRGVIMKLCNHNNIRNTKGTPPGPPLTFSSSKYVILAILCSIYNTPQPQTKKNLSILFPTIQYDAYYVYVCVLCCLSCWEQQIHTCEEDSSSPESSCPTPPFSFLVMSCRTHSTPPNTKTGQYSILILTVTHTSHSFLNSCMANDKNT